MFCPYYTGQLIVLSHIANARLQESGTCCRKPETGKIDWFSSTYKKRQRVPTPLEGDVSGHLSIWIPKIFSMVIQFGC